MKPRCSPLGSDNRLAAACGEFEKAAPARFFRTGNGARADEIADREIATVAGVMGDHLRDGPIGRRERGLGETHRCDAGAPHGVGRQIRLKRNVVAALCTIRCVGEIRQRRGIAFRPVERGDTERRERLARDDPRRHRGGEILAEERPQWLVFPTLHVARRPVVEQTEAKNMFRGPADRHGFAKLCWRADIHAKLKLEIHVPRRTIARNGFVAGFALALRPLHRRSAHANR